MKGSHSLKIGQLQQVPCAERISCRPAQQFIIANVFSAYAGLMYGCPVGKRDIYLSNVLIGLKVKRRFINLYLELSTQCAVFSVSDQKLIVRKSTNRALLSFSLLLLIPF